MAKKQRSLMDVVKQREYIEKCALCELPDQLKEEVEEGKKNGAQLKDIVAYLVQDHGYDEARLERQRSSTVMTQHFSKHMVLRGK